MKLNIADSGALKRERKDSVVSFRVPARVMLDLKARGADASIRVTGSANQYARKIVLEFLASGLTRIP